MLKSSLCDYSDAYVFVDRTIEIPNTGTEATPNSKENIIIKNCSPFTDSISEMHKCINR